MTDQRPISFWLKLVDRLIDDQFAMTLDEHGVTKQQWQLLNVLAHSPSTLEKLDAAMAPFQYGSATESAMDHLAELVESGWVVVVAGTEFDVTERGRAAFEGLAAVVSENGRRAHEGVTEQEYGETLGILERIARNLGYTG
jgi:DNA-binding MarR family transcriptional regulator